MLESFCGVGNPFLLGEIRQGERILDYGCGTGFDLFVAARVTGERGHVFGIDLTPEMANRARQNLSRLGISNAEVRTIESEIIPYPDSFVDVVISNGVINLTLDKQAAFREILRVLVPGGRFQFADIIQEKAMPADLASSPEAWSQ